MAWVTPGAGDWAPSLPACMSPATLLLGPPNAQAHRYPQGSRDRLRTDRHRPGRGVRLLGDAGHQGAPRRRRGGGAAQQQPRHRDDGPRIRSPHLHRAHHRRGRREDPRRRAAGLPAAHHGRADRPQPRQGPGRAGHPREVRRAADRRLARGHQQGRGPPALQGRHAEDRRGAAQERLRQDARRGPGRRRGDRLPRHHPPLVHPGRHRRRHRLQPRRVRGHLPRRPQGQPHLHHPGRRERARLEGVRAGGRPRLDGQRHHRLLHREPRPHGRAHGRLHHRGPRADAHGPRVPAPARGLAAHHPRDRRGHRRLQHPVRRQPEGWAHRRHRDEPARVAAPARWPPRPPGTPSRRSPPSWPSATRWTSCATTSRATRRPRSSPPSTTWW